MVALVTSWRLERSRESRERSAIEREFFDRLYALFPRLVDVVGVEDELDADRRKVLAPFFALYSHVWWSYESGVCVDPAWRGLKGHFEWWAQRPPAAAAWRTMRTYEDTWPDGFVGYVDRVVAPILDSETEAPGRAVP